MNGFFTTVSSPLGFLKISSDYYRLKSIDFVDDNIGNENSSVPVPDILTKASLQIMEYFKGSRQSFDLDLDPEGTYFQQKVWKLLTEVGYGKTKNYSEIAQELGSTKFARAVGMANGKNPLPIVIPCHRIIGCNGKLVGYSGGLTRKKWLLVHEQKYSGNALF